MRECKASRYETRVFELGDEAFECEAGHDLCACWTDGPCSARMTARCRCAACAACAFEDDDCASGPACRSCFGRAVAVLD